jgi:cation diffusion facilitator CzcD-associated flavoprotein CzcO
MDASGGRPTPEHFDVLIVGAGLSGIGAACRLAERCPDHRFAVLEARDRSGGTWDLFRYPGVRSDSDMFTLGYPFRPWTGAKAIADGPAILAYLRETAREHGIDRHIRYRHRLVRADWSSERAAWAVDVEVDRGGEKETRRLSCGLLFMCSGYYRYDEGHAPAFAGAGSFAGRIVHPQRWPEDLEVAGKRIVVIGSGATAVAQGPALARSSARETMRHRSPRGMLSRPSEDGLATRLRRWLPLGLANRVMRWQRVLLTLWFFHLCRTRPARARRLLLGGVRQWRGKERRLDPDFTPRYDPWRQRLCLVPDGDLFRALNDGRAAIVTGEIDRFTPGGVRLADGAEIAADIVVTATGLVLQAFGGATISVDGLPVDWPSRLAYKGTMFSGVPNLVSVFGYTNASWTLKSDLVSEWVCRLLAHLRRTGMRRATPTPREPDPARAPWLDLDSGYVQRSLHLFPRQGSKPPWKLHQNYLKDLVSLRWARIDDGVLRFSNPAPQAGALAPPNKIDPLLRDRTPSP